MNTNNDVQDCNIVSTGNDKIIGPVVPPGVGTVDNTRNNIADDKLAKTSGAEVKEDYGSLWVAEDIAWSISNRIHGLPYAEVDGYDLEKLVPSTIGEETQPPPELFENYRSSAADIIPASDTGQAISGNCSSRKTVGQVLSDSMFGKR